jgi:hypothetical protein
MDVIQFTPSDAQVKTDDGYNNILPIAGAPAMHLRARETHQGEKRS